MPLIAFFFFPLHLSTRYLVLFNPIEQERLCAVTVLVNTVKVRVLTEDGQTLPVQLSAQWSSASQMSAEVFEVRGKFHQRPRRLLFARCEVITVVCLSWKKNRFEAFLGSAASCCKLNKVI